MSVLRKLLDKLRTAALIGREMEMYFEKLIPCLQGAWFPHADPRNRRGVLRTVSPHFRKWERSAWKRPKLHAILVSKTIASSESLEEGRDIR
jgi:hypothetical protein